MPYAPAFNADLEVESSYVADARPYVDGLRPQIDTNAARGIIIGLGLSAILWVGIIAAIWVAF
jgi:hypothetical protein